MKLKSSFKQRLPWILLIIATFLLLLLFANRYLFFQRTIAYLDKVNITWMGYTDRKIIALTFDDGPDPVYTPQILQILQKYHIPATFFVEGANVEQYPEILKAEIKDGHSIGNHTYNHPRLSALNKSGILMEIVSTDLAIRKVTGQSPPFIRPPYEELTENILSITRNLHKIIVLSTITLEHETARTPRAKAERVIGLAFPGAIILAHDGRLNRSTSIKALPYVITGLKSKGYRFVSLKELLYRKSNN